MAKRNPPITLQSGHFSNSSELDALTKCLNDDAGHIQKGATGDKVRRIQQALRNVPGVTISDREFDGMLFGETTERAVVKFKGPPRNILQSWQKVPDPIVGMRTLEQLDLLMTGGGGGKITPTRELQIVVFQETSPMLMAEAKHDPSKSDLASTPGKPTGPHFTPLDTEGLIAVSRLRDARRETTETLRGHLFRELIAGLEAGALMHATFVSNQVAGAIVTFGQNSLIGRLVVESPEFTAANAQVKEEMTKALQASAATGILDYRVLKEPNHKISPVWISFGRASVRLKFAIGSTQGSRVLLEDFVANKSGSTVDFSATVNYELFDHFGADDSDLLIDRSLHGSPGQIALWVLQRERHPGCMPFVPKIMIQTRIDGTL